MKPQPLSSTDLHTLQNDTFNYFIHETNLQNGLVPDSTRKGSHSSIAAIGLGLASYPIGVERKFINREEAASQKTNRTEEIATQKGNQEEKSCGCEPSTSSTCLSTGARRWYSRAIRRFARPLQT